MDLRRLRFFVSVAEHLNFSRAAEALHTAQPSLSQQIRKLERELGGALFERTKRHVALTELGKDLFVEAQGVLEAADGLVTRMRDASGVPRGRLRVGSIMPATMGVLPRVLPSYRERFPQVEISVTTVGLDEQVRALAERRIDVGILRGPVADERIHTARIADDFFCVSLPKNHALAQRKRVAMRDLENETLVKLQPERGGSYHDNVWTLFRRHKFLPIAVMDVSDLAAVFALIASGVGVGVTSTVFRDVSFAQVVYRPLTPRTPIKSMMVACRRDRQFAPVVRSFIEHVESLKLVFAPPD